MEHTYLRYECADSFGLVASSASSKAPASNSSLASFNTSSGSVVITTAGSYCVGYNVKTCLPVFKLGHREQLTGGVGTGRALNGSEIVCLDVYYDAVGHGDTTRNSAIRVATGWVDGAVRVFDLSPEEALQGFSGSSSQQQNLAHSLIHDNSNEDFVQREPLVLNGHGGGGGAGGVVRAVAFDRSDASRLASGGSDGAVVLWDIVSETGLFRLLGHRGSVTDIRFVRLSDQNRKLDGLITACLDGLVKVWDIQGQCCIQTIANQLGGEVWGADCVDTAIEEASGIGGNLAGDDCAEPSSRWRLVTGGNDGQVRVWAVEASTDERSRAVVSGTDDNGAAGDVNTIGASTGENAASAPGPSSTTDEVCKYMGILSPPPNVATSTEKISAIRFHRYNRHYFIGILRGQSKAVDVYKLRSTQESHKKRQRRLKRRHEKQKDKSRDSEAAENAKPGQKRGILDDLESSSSEDERGDGNKEGQLLQPPEHLKPSDEFEYLTSVRATHKIRNFAFVPHRDRGELTRVVCALATNAFETHALVRRKTNADAKAGATSVVISERITAMDIFGHPTGIRAVALSSDDSMACTVSKSVMKIWNVESRTCIQSLSPTITPASKSATPCYGLCAIFLPGNTHAVIGTREGHLIVIDVAAGDVVYSEPNAHDGAIWAIDLRRTALSSVDAPITLVTGSADKTVKFWVVASDEGGSDEEAYIGVSTLPERPIVVHTRTLQLTDDVVAVRYSHSTDPTKAMVFVSTLDSTIKVFFDDSLKLFLSLYGHKLPALAVDCSDDDAILASCGADKTVKIWGLDFGDTHRTLHGHDDSVTDLRFVRRTHNFFTCSKDGTVRYWDGDRFEQILLLDGHSAEVNCLAVSRTGAFVLSGGMDRQVRVWERTKDIVFLEEERERRLEQMFEKVNDQGQGGTAGILERTGDESDGEGEELPQSEEAIKKSMLSVAAGDRLMEALERADQELKEIILFRRGTVKKRNSNPMLFGLEPAHYVLWVLKSIKSTELEQSLLVLPLSHLERMIYYCTVLLREGRGVEICSRVAVFMIKVHQKQVRARLRRCLACLDYVLVLTFPLASLIAACHGQLFDRTATRTPSPASSPPWRVA